MMAQVWANNKVPYYMFQQFQENAMSDAKTEVHTWTRDIFIMLI